jgi:hypothetical protein
MLPYQITVANKGLFMNLLTPCCNARIIATLGYSGHGYGAERVCEGYMCSAAHCFNEWDLDGNPI